jgi:hypothetical protein
MASDVETVWINVYLLWQKNSCFANWCLTPLGVSANRDLAADTKSKWNSTVLYQLDNEINYYRMDAFLECERQHTQQRCWEGPWSAHASLRIPYFAGHFLTMSQHKSSTVKMSTQDAWNNIAKFHKSFLYHRRDTGTRVSNNSWSAHSSPEVLKLLLRCEWMTYIL